jgi:hypothetical protein
VDGDKCLRVVTALLRVSVCQLKALAREIDESPARFDLDDIHVPEMPEHLRV